MSTFYTFGTLQAARDYRHNNGTGGWIFEPTSVKEFGYECILFPPEFSPSDIFRHQLTRGMSGNLIAN